MNQARPIMLEPSRERQRVTRMVNPRPVSNRILSSGVVVVHWKQDHYHYLLLRAYNYWDFPKGVVEVDESPLEAAIREVEEETTLTDCAFGGAMCTGKPILTTRAARWHVITSPNRRRPRFTYPPIRNSADPNTANSAGSITPRLGAY